MARPSEAKSKVGQVVQTLPMRQPVIGIASINDKICVLRKKRDEAIEVYDAATYVRQRFMTVPDVAAQPGGHDSV